MNRNDVSDSSFLEKQTLMNITLPAATVLIERLLTVSQTPDFVQHFYPLLLKSAGRNNDAHGIIMLIELAISNSATKVPALQGALTLHMSDWITACITDSVCAAETRALWLDIKRHVSAHKA